MQTKATLALMAAPITAFLLPAPASARPAGSQAFAASPVSDAVLDAATGTGLAGREVRTLSDHYSVDCLQQIDQANRITLDNWWAQPGAALIAASITMARAGQ